MGAGKSTQEPLEVPEAHLLQFWSLQEMLFMAKVDGFLAHRELK